MICNRLPALYMHSFLFILIFHSFRYLFYSLAHYSSSIVLIILDNTTKRRSYLVSDEQTMNGCEMVMIQR